MALTVRNVSKRYGAQIALDSVSFSLSGGVVSLLGANGAGKSTLLRVLATLVKPDTGDISFNGYVYGRDQPLLRAQIGYLPQHLELPESLTPHKLLNYLAQLRGGEVGLVMDALQLETIADQPLGQLSGGQRRLVGVAQALLGHPRLLLLDELTRGIDLIEREQIYRAVRVFNGLTVFSTHVPDDAEHLAQTVIVMQQGRVLYCGEVEALRAAAVGQVFEFWEAAENLPPLMASMRISRIIANRDSYSLVRVVGQPIRSGAAAVAPSLEDAYLLLTCQ